MHRGIALIEHFFESRLDRLDVHRAGPRQQSDEGGTVQSTDHVAFPEAYAQHIGKGFQGIVALGATEQVVDALEVVEVKKQQGRRPAQLLANVQPQLGQCDEPVPIGQQRQLIHARHLHADQFLLGLARQVAKQFALLQWRAQRVCADARLMRLAWDQHKLLQWRRYTLESPRTGLTPG